MPYGHVTQSITGDGCRRHTMVVETTGTGNTEVAGWVCPESLFTIMLFGHFRGQENIPNTIRPQGWMYPCDLCQILNLLSAWVIFSQS